MSEPELLTRDELAGRLGIEPAAFRQRLKVRVRAGVIRHAGMRIVGGLRVKVYDPASASPMLLEPPPGLLGIQELADHLGMRPRSLQVFLAANRESAPAAAFESLVASFGGGRRLYDLVVVVRALAAVKPPSKVGCSPEPFREGAAFTLKSIAAQLRLGYTTVWKIVKDANLQPVSSAEEPGRPRRRVATYCRDRVRTLVLSRRVRAFAGSPNATVVVAPAAAPDPDDPIALVEMERRDFESWFASTFGHATLRGKSRCRTK